jgi:hypothetical protein
MKRQYFVVDQNYLRSFELESRLAADPHLQVVLPDMAMLEMTKSDKRELTVRLSLEILSRYRNRVYVAFSISEALRLELDSKRPITDHMLFREATTFIRKVLEAVATGIDNDEILRIIQDPENCLLDLKRDYLNDEVNKSKSLSLVEATKCEMPREFAMRLRGKRATEEERLLFVAEKAPSLLVSVLADNGFSREKAIMFLRKKPMLLRYFYLKVLASLNWEEMGRLESLSAPKVSNDLLDHEYILTATFFDGLLSDEPRANEAYQTVSKLTRAGLILRSSGTQ